MIGRKKKPAEPVRLPATVTFLEMTEKPEGLPPPMPRSALGPVALMQAHNPPVHFYRYLYNTIGGPHYWVDRRKIDDIELARIIQDPQNVLYVLYVAGNPAGMAEIDFRQSPVARLSYFGLIPEYIGQKFSHYFLYHAVCNAWAHPIASLKVNTCTLDNPRALTLYQRMGFHPYAQEERCVELP